MNARRDCSGGFTLIELLLGAVITAVLLAALHAIFQGLLQGQARAYARIEMTAPRAQVVTTISRDLENMVVPNGVLSGSVVGTTDGPEDRRTDSLEFGTTSGRVSQNKPWGDVQKVSYYLNSPEDPEEESGAQLIRAATRNLLATDTEDQREETPLLQHVQSLQFEYYDGQIWNEAWDSTTLDNEAPRAVRMLITFVDDETGKTPTPPPIEIVKEVAARKVTATTTTAGVTR